jgi:hypothetical protein
MELLIELLPIIIYVLLILLLIICIIIGYKVVTTMNHIEKIVDDVDEKVQSFNKFFGVLNFATDKIALYSDSIISYLTTAIIALFKPKKKKTKKEQDTAE